MGEQQQGVVGKEKEAGRQSGDANVILCKQIANSI
jgi:hypothetical protein